MPDQWEDVTWGAPPERIGRVPMGVLVALSEQADVMVFGSGASEKDGMLESEATARLLWERFDELTGFAVFKGWETELTRPPGPAGSGSGSNPYCTWTGRRRTPVTKSPMLAGFLSTGTWSGSSWSRARPICRGA